MELEIGVEDLLNKNRVESNRIEFKASWNPDDIYRSVCAFANDFDNVGGGYVVVGVEARNGFAIRPVKGMDVNDIDAIQREIVGYNNLITPVYMPNIIVEEVDGRNIIVLWVPAGERRPYKVPEHVTAQKDRRSYYYIRYDTSLVRANQEQEIQLIEKSRHFSFDSGANHEAVIGDISKCLLENHLHKTGSKLAEMVQDSGTEAILGNMGLLTGPSEHPYVQNAAVMMFCDHMEKFFPCSRVEITVFPKGRLEDPRNFYEIPAITGSVPEIIARTMTWLHDNVIFEKVTKIDNQMEALRRFSYPYAALEEAVVNAFYHRDYQTPEPVIIEVEPDVVRIVSFPGIDNSVSMETIEKGESFLARYCRNKRLGEFLKELDLTEGKSTGIPTIQKELKKNGSPKAVFSTDSNRRFLTVEIPIHPDFLPDNKIDTLTGAIKQVTDDSKTVTDDSKTVTDDSKTVTDDSKKLMDNLQKIAKNKLYSLPGNEIKILLLLLDNEEVTVTLIARELNLSESTVNRSLKNLIDRHIIAHVGSRRSGYWKINI